MRSKIFLYLFVFTLMFTIFIYVNDKKILDSKDAYIESLEKKVRNQEGKIEEVNSDVKEAHYFSLLHNEEAITYLEDQGIDAIQLEQLLKDEIIGRNRAGEDNDLVPFSGMDGIMRINKVKVLNHKWIIADFTDGKYWGEIFMIYDIDEQNNLLLNTEKSFLYPAN